MADRRVHTDREHERRFANRFRLVKHLPRIRAIPQLNVHLRSIGRGRDLVGAETMCQQFAVGRVDQLLRRQPTLKVISNLFHCD